MLMNDLVGFKPNKRARIVFSGANVGSFGPAKMAGSRRWKAVVAAVLKAGASMVIYNVGILVKFHNPVQLKLY